MPIGLTDIRVDHGWSNIEQYARAGCLWAICAVEYRDQLAQAIRPMYPPEDE